MDEPRHIFRFLGKGFSGRNTNERAVGKPPSPPPQNKSESEEKILRRRKGGLSGKLLLFTVAFVMLSEIFIYVPSIANYRNTWLINKLTIAGVGATILSDMEQVPAHVQNELLEATGAFAIAFKDGDRRRLIAMRDNPPMADSLVNMNDMSPFRAIIESFATLWSGADRTMRVIGKSQMGQGQTTRVELMLPERLLRNDMLRFSGRILALSLMISIVTASLVYISLRWLFLRPMKRLTQSMALFAQAPDDISRAITPSRRNDEIGDAESRLSQMQHTLHDTLHQQRRLADLGLAVSKINHDLRNLLASAQLFSERLETIPDPTVRRIAPKIIATIDRAVAYTQAVLSYGRAKEAPPQQRLIHLRRLAEDVSDLLGLNGDAEILFENKVPDDFEINADPDHLFRVLMNLCRNSRQALETNKNPLLVRRITIDARRDGAHDVIHVSDTGPGIPEKIRSGLFKPFQSSTKQDGSGLGLAIAAELMRAHGGNIELLASQASGATFAILLPRQNSSTNCVLPEEKRYQQANK